MPHLKQPRSRRGPLLLAGLAGLGLLAAGAVNAGFDRGAWRTGGDGVDRRARAERFCRNDTERYHPVIRAFARADLRLDGAQATRFDQLADLVLPGLEEVKREACNDFATRGGPAPERLAQLAGVLRRAADTAERAVEPARQFYGSLSEDQKRRVDELADRRRGGPSR